MFSNVNEFLELFSIKNVKEEEAENIFYDPVPLKNRNIGFSVRINYPKKIKYKPLKTKAGKIDESCLIHVIYDNSSQQIVDKEKVPIILRCVKFSRYYSDQKRYTYDFDDEESPTKESVERNKRLQKYAPRDVWLFSPLYFDHRKSKFIDEKDNEYTGDELLKDIFKYHIRASKRIVGIPLRAMVRIKRVFVFFVSLLERFLKFCLRFFFGRTIRPEDPVRADIFGEGYQKQDIVLEEMDSLSIFGYQASKRVIITFSWLSLLGYSFCRLLKWKPIYIVSIVKNPFLTLVSTICVLGFLDIVVPKVLLIILNLVNKFRCRIEYGIKSREEN